LPAFTVTTVEKMKRSLFVFGSIALYSTAVCGELAQDSVVNGRHRGDSGVNIGAQQVGLSYILNGVSMASSSKNEHVRYGPFKNDSDLVLTIVLQHTGSSPNWSEFGAWIAGQKIMTKQGGIEFKVAPGDEYFFSAKDISSITAMVNSNHYQGPSTGLPSAEDFSAPSGVYRKCYRMVRYEPDYYEYPGEIFIYEADKMSDRSVRLDSYNLAHQDLTRGVPLLGGHNSCELVDYLDYIYFMKE
jgi:hypothetical protein